MPHPSTIHVFTIQVVPECYKADEISVKAVNRCFFCICFCSGFIQRRRNDRAVSEDHFLFNILSWLI